MKACQKIRNVIEAQEAQILGLEKEFDAAFAPTGTVPFDEDSFNKAYEKLESAVKQKRSELGLSGKMDESPQGQVELYMKMMEKGGNSPEETLSALTQMRAAGGADKNEKKAIENATTPYINAIRTLQNGKTEIKKMDGTTEDKSSALKNAMFSHNVVEMNNIVEEINKNKPEQSGNVQNPIVKNSTPKNENGFSDLFNMLN